MVICNGVVRACVFIAAQGYTRHQVNWADFPGPYAYPCWRTTPRGYLMELNDLNSRYKLKR